jgi:hypothetical protein
VAVVDRLRRRVLAISMVSSPLLILIYWLLYPAYGHIHADEILRAISDDPGRTQLSDAFAFSGAFLAVPWSLGYLEVLRDRSARLAMIGAAMTMVGWIAVIATLMTDVVAVELGGQGQLFERVYASGFSTAMNALASMHIVGAVLLGIALTRSRLVPRWLGVAFTLAAPVHLASNLSGLLWIDAVTWLLVAAVGVLLAPHVSRELPA